MTAPSVQLGPMGPHRELRLRLDGGVRQLLRASGRALLQHQGQDADWPMGAGSNGITGTLPLTASRLPPVRAARPRTRARCSKTSSPARSGISSTTPAPSRPADRPAARTARSSRSSTLSCSGARPTSTRLPMRGSHAGSTCRRSCRSTKNPRRRHHAAVGAAVLLVGQEGAGLRGRRARRMEPSASTETRPDGLACPGHPR